LGKVSASHAHQQHGSVRLYKKKMTLHILIEKEKKHNFREASCVSLSPFFLFFIRIKTMRALVR
jgi:hypothetical protein